MQRNATLVLFILMLLSSKAKALNFIAYGDTRSSKSTHQKIVDAFAQRNPELVIHSGDLWDGYSSSEFKAVLQKNSNIAALLTRNDFLVSRGNHETESAVLNFEPPIVRDNKILYSFIKDDCFFISMGYDPRVNSSWLEQQLNSAQSKNAIWRIIFVHQPIYSTGEHGASGVSAFESLCDKYKVTLVVSGHDHDYERTHQIFNKAVVSKEQILNGGKGTIYMVSGGGGAPLYAVGSGWWTNTFRSTYHYVEINTSQEKFEAVTRTIDGTVLDQFVIKNAVSVDSSAPLISDAAPQGMVPVGPILISATTNESAVLRWSFQDIPFDSMKNTLDQKESGLAHSATIADLTPGSHTVFIRARDNANNITPISTKLSFTLNPSCIQAKWFENAYLDDTWKLGATEIGYGDGTEKTILPFAESTFSGFPTLYTRKTFSLSPQNSTVDLKFQLDVDDGAVIYLNGKELDRPGMNPGDIVCTTLAAGVPQTRFTYSFKPSDYNLKLQDNLIAVEVHQRKRNGANISFDLTLSSASGPIISSGDPWLYFDKGIDPPPTPCISPDIPVAVSAAQVNPPLSRSFMIRQSGSKLFIDLDQHQSADIFIKSLDGKIIRKFSSLHQNRTKKIPLSGLAKGVYLIEIKGTTFSKTLPVLVR